MSVKQQWLHYISTLNQAAFMKLVFMMGTALSAFSIPDSLPGVIFVEDVMQE